MQAYPDSTFALSPRSLSLVPVNSILRLRNYGDFRARVSFPDVRIKRDSLFLTHSNRPAAPLLPTRESQIRTSRSGSKPSIIRKPPIPNLAMRHLLSRGTIRSIFGTQRTHHRSRIAHHSRAFEGPTGLRGRGFRRAIRGVYLPPKRHCRVVETPYART